MRGAGSPRDSASHQKQQGHRHQHGIGELHRLDMEVAEDAALTMKLRQVGYRIRFAPGAVGKTKVPETVTGLTLQRLRWDAGLITIWCRRYIGNISPLSPNFRLTEALVILDIIWFSIVLPLVFPIYFRSGHADFPHPALGQDITPSPTARRAQAQLRLVVEPDRRICLHAVRCNFPRAGSLGRSCMHSGARA